MKNMISKKTPKYEEDNFQFVNSIKLGEGSPVILIHGLAASIYDWTELMPDLAEAGYASYALDLLGHGKSYKPEYSEDYNIENVILHFEDWIDSQIPKVPIFIIGHSLGAYVAIRFFLKHPERVVSMVLCDPFYDQNQLPLLLRINYRYSILDTALLKYIPEWFIKQIIDFSSKVIRNGFELSESVRSQTANDYKRAEPRIFNIVNSIDDLTPMLNKINIPILVVWGENDQTLNPKSFITLVRFIKCAESYEVLGAGHVPHQSHSAEFNKKVIQFFDKIRLEKPGT